MLLEPSSVFILQFKYFVSHFFLLLLCLSVQSIFHCPRQGCQIELVSIRFLIDTVQKPFDLIWFRFNMDLIKNRFHSIQKPPQQTWKKLVIWKLTNHIKVLYTRMAKIPENLFCDDVLWILHFLLSQFRVFLVHLSVQIEPHQIVSKIVNIIRFDMSKNFRFDKEIWFDFDSIWQPWPSIFFKFSWSPRSVTLCQKRRYDRPKMIQICF